MDNSKAFFVCAVLILGLASHSTCGFRSARSTGGARAGASSYAGSMAFHDDIQAKINSHFQSVEAQNKAIQADIDRQIQEHQKLARQGSWAKASATMTNGDSQPDPATQMYANTFSSPVDGVPAPDFNNFPSGHQAPIPYAHNNAAGDAHRFGNNVNSRYGGFDGFGDVGSDDFGTGGFSSGGFGGHQPASAISSVSFGPNGGFQAGEISPVEEGVQSRFAEDVPASSGGGDGGNSYAVFSSSSSSQSVGPDGKVISKKSSTTGINDNGKVSIKTVHDP